MKKCINMLLLMCVLLSFGCSVQTVEAVPTQEPTIEPTIEPTPEPVTVLGPNELGVEWENTEAIDDSFYNGYRYESNGKWIPGIPTYKSWFTPAPKITIGNAYPYGW